MAISWAVLLSYVISFAQEVTPRESSGQPFIQPAEAITKHGVPSSISLIPPPVRKDHRWHGYHHHRKRNELQKQLDGDRAAAITDAGLSAVVHTQSEARAEGEAGTEATAEVTADAAIKAEAAVWMTRVNMSDPNDVVRSLSDRREYRFITLENGLHALLISDPTTQKAAAAMDCGSGYFTDPPAIPGLAHFLEHMLFLGTAKYPSEEDYDTFLSAHGGDFNAYTSHENTNFFFSIDPHHFDRALDRFAQFFVSPLLTESATSREIKAVNAEHSKNKQDDNWRFSELKSFLASSDSPYHKFGTGNIKTLSHTDPATLRKQLFGSWSTHFVASNLQLVVLSRAKLWALEAIVRERFNAVPPTSDPNFARPSTPTTPLFPITKRQAYNSELIETDTGTSVDHSRTLNKNKLTTLFASIPVPVPYSDSSRNSNSLQHNDEQQQMSEEQGIKSEEQNSGEWDAAMASGGPSAGLPNPKDVTALLTALAQNKSAYRGVYPSTVLGSKVYFRSVQDTNSLILTWPLPSQTSMFRSKGLDYITTLLSSEAKGSLSSILKTDKGWVNAIIPGSDDLETSFFHLFTVEFQLTELGGPHIDDIIRHFYTYLSIIQNKGIQAWRFAEMARQQRLLFDYKDKEQPISYVCELARNMALYPSQWVLAGPALYLDFDSNHINDLIRLINPDNMIAYVFAKRLNVPLPFKEIWYGINYNIETLPSSVRKLFISPLQNVGYQLREKNAWLPGDVSVRWPSALKMASPSAPNIILESTTPALRLWFSQGSFDLPFVNFNIRLWSSEGHNSARAAALTDLYIALFNDMFQPNSYYPAQAGFTYTITSNSNGIQIAMSGYTDGLGKYAVEILSRLNPSESLGVQLGEARFKDLKSNLLRVYHNQRYTRAQEYGPRVGRFVLTPSTLAFHASHLVRALEGVKFRDILDHQATLFADVQIEALLHGNIWPSEAIAWMEEIGEKFHYTTISTPFTTPGARTQHLGWQGPRLSQLPPASYTTLITSHPNPEEENSVVYNYYQVGRATIVEEVYAAIMEKALEKPIYNTLRTKEQLGYIVWSFDETEVSVPGFAIEVQSANYSAAYVNSRIEALLPKLRQVIYNIASPSKEQKVKLSRHRKSRMWAYVSSVYSDYIQNYTTLGEETKHYWAEIINGQLRFDRYDQLAAICRNQSLINGHGLRAFFDLIFGFEGSPSSTQRRGRTLSVQVGPGENSTGPTVTPAQRTAQKYRFRHADSWISDEARQSLTELFGGNSDSQNLEEVGSGSGSRSHSGSAGSGSAGSAGSAGSGSAGSGSAGSSSVGSGSTGSGSAGSGSAGSDSTGSGSAGSGSAGSGSAGSGSAGSAGSGSAGSGSAGSGSAGSGSASSGSAGSGSGSAGSGFAGSGSGSSDSGAAGSGGSGSGGSGSGSGSGGSGSDGSGSAGSGSGGSGSGSGSAGSGSGGSGSGGSGSGGSGSGGSGSGSGSGPSGSSSASGSGSGSDSSSSSSLASGSGPAAGDDTEGALLQTNHFVTKKKDPVIVTTPMGITVISNTYSSSSPTAGPPQGSYDVRIILDDGQPLTTSPTPASLSPTPGPSSGPSTGPTTTAPSAVPTEPPSRVPLAQEMMSALLPILGELGVGVEGRGSSGRANPFSLPELNPPKASGKKLDLSYTQSRHQIGKDGVEDEALTITVAAGEAHREGNTGTIGHGHQFWRRPQRNQQTQLRQSHQRRLKRRRTRASDELVQALREGAHKDNEHEGDWVQPEYREKRGATKVPAVFSSEGARTHSVRYQPHLRSEHRPYHLHGDRWPIWIEQDDPTLDSTSQSHAPRRNKLGSPKGTGGLTLGGSGPTASSFPDMALTILHSTGVVSSGAPRVIKTTVSNLAVLTDQCALYPLLPMAPPPEPVDYTRLPTNSHPIKINLPMRPIELE